MFAEVGIDLADVRTYDQYLDARRRAGPWFLEHLQRIARGEPGTPMTLERRALIAAVGDDDAEYQRLARQLETRDRLRVIKGSG